MKAVKDRLRKMNLFSGTRTKDISGAGPDEPPKAGAAPRACSEGRRPQRRGITKALAGDLIGLYDIGGHVTESAHMGVEVRFGRRRCNGEQVTIKTREKSSFSGTRDEREWRKTVVAQLNMPRSEGVCEYFAVYETRDKYFVVMERVRGMDLFDHVQKGHVDQEGARQILFQMLGALKAMHAHGRIHKDLKLENVMVDLSAQQSPAKVCRFSSDGSCSPKMSRDISNGSGAPVTAKLIDFDNAEGWDPSSPKKAKDVLGTPGYIAPEAYSGDYSPASDVYSVGVIMYRLLTGRLPYRLEIFAHPPGENWVGSPAMERIQDRLVSTSVDFERPPFDKMPDAQDLVKKMMALDASERPSAAEALEHPWIWRAGRGRRLSSNASTSAGSSRAPSSESSAAPTTPTPPPATCPTVETEAPLEPKRLVRPRPPSLLAPEMALPGVLG